MSKEVSVIEADVFERMEKVADLHTQGVGPQIIAKRLGMTRVEVKNHIEQWQEVLNNDQQSRDWARDHLNKMVVHYDNLIAKSYDNLKALHTLPFDEKVSAQVNSTLKNIAEFEAKRVDLLQKAGLMDAHDLGDELAERERREEGLIHILQNDLCPECQQVVARRLQQLTGKVQIVREYDE